MVKISNQDRKEKTMKRALWIVLGILFCLCFSACGEQKGLAASESPAQMPSETQNNTETLYSKEEGTSSDKPEIAKGEEKKLKLIIEGQELDVTLYDTPAANALYTMLPLELTFEDYNETEKIAYINEKLPTEGEPDEFDPDVGDLCVYAPWGNLVIFYKDFRASKGLISLGHIDSDMEMIGSIEEDFSATLQIAK